MSSCQQTSGFVISHRAYVEIPGLIGQVLSPKGIARCGLESTWQQ